MDTYQEEQFNIVFISAMLGLLLSPLILQLIIVSLFCTTETINKIMKKLKQN